MKKCSYCGAQVTEDSRFCGNCGKELTNAGVCPYCGASVKKGDGFCWNCGKSLGEAPGEVHGEAPGGNFNGDGRSKKYLPYLVVGGVIVLAVIVFFFSSNFKIVSKSKIKSDSLALVKDKAEAKMALQEIVSKTIDDKMYVISNLDDYFTAEYCENWREGDTGGEHGFWWAETDDSPSKLSVVEFDLISENEAKAKVRLTGYNYVGYFDVIIKKGKDVSWLIDKISITALLYDAWIEGHWVCDNGNNKMHYIFKENIVTTYYDDHKDVVRGFFVQDGDKLIVHTLGGSSHIRIDSENKSLHDYYSYYNYYKMYKVSE